MMKTIPRTQAIDDLADFRTDQFDSQDIVDAVRNGRSGLESWTNHELQTAYHDWLDTKVIVVGTEPPHTPAPLYIIRRKSADGLEIDVFTDEALATEWAALVGVDVTTEHPIDRTILNAMKETYVEIAPDTEEEGTPS
ncbi:MAG: hypothetical protein ABL983_00170 [Nitrospira sp.]